VALVGHHGIPVLGINLGRLGFISHVQLEEVGSALDRVARGAFRLDERSMLSLEGHNGDQDDWPHALNEVSVHKRDTYTMVAVHAYLDGQFLNTYWSDGLIVATPTGSTAYSLSCGGPLLDPHSKALVLTPIAPHNLNVRPYVVPDDVTITLVVEARGDKYLVNRDSRSSTLAEPVPLTIRKAPFAARLVQLEGVAFMDTLRTKLNWGLDARSAPPELDKP
jgi:NAD+ kinase